jgi:microcystin degradation protein MlrC
MEVESIGDAEGRLAGAVRDIVGCATPVSVSLDLHCNISPQLAASANVLTAYRTAPHRDRSETRRRALALLIEAIRNNRRPVSALVKAPLLLAGESALTSVEPARSLYEELPAIARAFPA